MVGSPCLLPMQAESGGGWYGGAGSGAGGADEDGDGSSNEVVAALSSSYRLPHFVELLHHSTGCQAFLHRPSLVVSPNHAQE